MMRGMTIESRFRFGSGGVNCFGRDMCAIHARLLRWGRDARDNR